MLRFYSRLLLAPSQGFIDKAKRILPSLEGEQLQVLAMVLEGNVKDTELAVVLAEEKGKTMMLEVTGDEVAMALQTKGNELVKALQAKQNEKAMALAAKEKEKVMALQATEKEIAMALQTLAEEKDIAVKLKAQEKDMEMAVALAVKQKEMELLMQQFAPLYNRRAFERLMSHLRTSKHFAHVVKTKTPVKAMSEHLTEKGCAKSDEQALREIFNNLSHELQHLPFPMSIESAQWAGLKRDEEALISTVYNWLQLTDSRARSCKKKKK